MKLIDADKLKMSFKPYFDGKKTIGQIIDEQPTVEAQPTDAVSREEAIFIVDEYAIGGETWAQRKDCVELLKQLPSVQPQPCEDAVSRQDLIDKATSWDSHFADSERAVSLKDIMEMPSVTPRMNLAETSQDCVSRQAVIDKATSWDTHFADSERYVSLSDIEALPPVTPERPKGRWIPNGDGVKHLYANYHCSECGSWVYEQSKFCPDCGWPMEVDINDDK